MKLTTAFISCLSFATVDSFRLRRSAAKGDATGSVVDDVSAVDNVEDERSLQWVPWCWVDNQPPPEKYHPVYSAGWNDGFCELSSDCNSPGYDTQLECCNTAYKGQATGTCVGGLPDPPTDSPTSSPTDSPIEPPPPPAPTTGTADFWYPNYEVAWSEAGCSNALPLPYANVKDRPNFPTQLECCNAAYANQASGACYGGLADPPTDSPTSSPTDSPIEPPPPVPTKSPVKAAPTTGTADFWYPDYDVSWSEAGCSNAFPLPYANIGDRPNFPTQLECCNAEYPNQASGACYGGLADPPTDSPTSSPTDSPIEPPPPVPTKSPVKAAPTTGTADFWYPDYDVAWSEAGCSNAFPLPYANIGDRPNFPTQLECCNAEYPNQASGACYGGLADPPTDSPTPSPTDSPVIPAPTTGTADFWYPDYGVSWSDAGCLNALPLPYANIGDRPNFPTQQECCDVAYGGQTSGKCISQIP